MIIQGFGERIKQAILAHASQIGERYTNVRFAEEVGEAELGRGEPYSTSSVTEWISERSEPSLLTFRAMSKVTGRELAWLLALDVEPRELAKRIDPASLRPVPRPQAKKRKRSG